MNGDGSVTQWIQLMRQGDHGGAQKLWERYFVQLSTLAHRKMRGKALVVADAEDVALSAMDSVFRGLERGRFPGLQDRENLVRLLVVVTARKMAHLLRDQQRQKRGGAIQQQVADVSLDEIIGNEPTPEFASQVAEESERLLALLGRDDLRQVALGKLEGLTNEEIARNLGCVPRSVDRKLSLIRKLWELEATP